MTHDLLTTRTIADRLGVTPRCALARAAARGIAPDRTIGHTHLWRPDTVRRLTPRPVGRPPAR